MARRIPDTIKAQAIAQLLVGEAPSVVAQKLGLNRTTVAHWSQRLIVTTSATEKRDIFAELIDGYLKEVLVTLAAQAVHTRGSSWLEKQPADGLAILHGVLNDKAVRILAALQRDIVQQPDSPRLLPPRDAGVSEPAPYSEDDR